MSVAVRAARDPREIDEALALRREVFVDEQGVAARPRVRRARRRGAAPGRRRARTGRSSGPAACSPTARRSSSGRMVVAAPARRRGIGLALLARRRARGRRARRTAHRAQRAALGRGVLRAGRVRDRRRRVRSRRASSTCGWRSLARRHPGDPRLDRRRRRRRAALGRGRGARRPPGARHPRLRPDPRRHVLHRLARQGDDRRRGGARLRVGRAAVRDRSGVGDRHAGPAPAARRRPER